MPKFKHQPMQDHAKEIRLLRFVDVNDVTELKLEITNFDQSSAPPYVALSYEWGEPDPDIDTSMTVSGKQLAVRYNLQDFLRVIISKIRSRRLHTDLWYWADAICIDQSTMSERNAQVSIMEKVYASAQEVFAWLGRFELAHETIISDFIGSTRDVLQIRYTSTSQVVQDRDSRAWSMLQDVVSICSASYWNRRWIAGK